MARWQRILVGTFAFITFSIFAALVVSLLEPPVPVPTPTRSPVPTFTPTSTPRPTAILMPSRPTTATPPVTATPKGTLGPIVRTHMVLPGETLVTIAEKYGVTVEAIEELNGLTNPDIIEEGQELLIPSP